MLCAAAIISWMMLQQSTTIVSDTTIAATAYSLGAAQSGEYGKLMEKHFSIRYSEGREYYVLLHTITTITTTQSTIEVAGKIQ
jgi:hypothetical protein